MKRKRIRLTIIIFASLLNAFGIYYLSKHQIFSPSLEGEKEVKAIFQAYRKQIKKITIKDNQWALFLDNRWFYWQDGKLLPESILTKSEEYMPYKFYKYPLELPKEIKKPTEKEIIKINNYTSGKYRKFPRSSAFLDTLYGGSSYKEIRKKIKNIKFLGYWIEAHEKIVPILHTIEDEIIKAAVKNDKIIPFIENLNNIGCFSWRNIENSKSKSYHSYGIAVDFIPSKSVRKHVYWGWSKYYVNKWYMISYKRRWQVPEEIIRIFENYGFIWGGKWLFYDNMHFEYRPEILILADKNIINLQE